MLEKKLLSLLRIHDACQGLSDSDVDEIASQGRFRHDQAMVSGRHARILDPGEDVVSVVVNRGCLPVHQPVGPDDFGSIDFRQALMPQADA